VPNWILLVRCLLVTSVSILCRADADLVAALRISRSVICCSRREYWSWCSPSGTWCLVFFRCIMRWLIQCDVSSEFVLRYEVLCARFRPCGGVAELFHYLWIMAPLWICYQILALWGFERVFDLLWWRHSIEATDFWVLEGNLDRWFNIVLHWILCWLWE